MLSARHGETFSSPRNYRFGIAGGFDVPGIVVPGTAGVRGDVGTVDGAPGIAGGVDGVLGVAGGVVAAPGPVPGMHGGWITPGVAPFAAVVGAGETADDPGGCDVVVDCGLTVFGAGAVFSTGAFTRCPGVLLPLGIDTPGCCALVAAGVVVPPVAGVAVRPVAGAMLLGVVAYGLLSVVTGTHGTVTVGGGLGGGICPGMFAGRPFGVGCAGDVVAGGVDGVWLEGVVGVWLCAATRTVEHAAATIRRLTVEVAVCLITSSPGCRFSLAGPCTADAGPACCSAVARRRHANHPLMCFSNDAGFFAKSWRPRRTARRRSAERCTSIQSRMTETACASPNR